MLILAVYLTTIVFFLILESGLSIIAACLPTFGPLFTSAGRLKLRSRGREAGSSQTRYPVLYNHPWFRRSKREATSFSLTNTSKVQMIPRKFDSGYHGIEIHATGSYPLDSEGDIERFDGNIKVTTDIDQESRNSKNLRRWDQM